MQIWKWPIEITDYQTIKVPAGTRLLTVQVQRGTPCIWGLCDERMGLQEHRRIGVYGTGNPMPDDPGKYLGTFQVHEGAPVFHVFEIGSL